MRYLSLADLVDELDQAVADTLTGPHTSDLLTVVPVLSAAAGSLRYLAGDGVSAGLEERTRTLTELATRCTDVAQAWAGLPDTALSRLVGVTGDAVSRSSLTDLGQSARWALALRLADLTRVLIDHLDSTPYAGLDKLRATRTAAAAVARTGALDPPDPAQLRSLDRPILPAGDHVAPAEAQLNEAVKRLVYLVHRADGPLPPITLEATCRAAAALITADPEQARAVRGWQFAAERLARMVAADLHTPGSLQTYAAAAALQQAARHADAIGDAIPVGPHLVELAGAVQAHVRRLPGHAIVPPAGRPYSPARIHEYLHQPLRAFAITSPDLDPIHQALTDAAAEHTSTEATRGFGTLMEPALDTEPVVPHEQLPLQPLDPHIDSGPSITW